MFLSLESCPFRPFNLANEWILDSANGTASERTVILECREGRLLTSEEQRPFFAVARYEMKSRVRSVLHDNCQPLVRDGCHQWFVPPFLIELLQRSHQCKLSFTQLASQLPEKFSECCTALGLGVRYQATSPREPVVHLVESDEAIQL